MLRAFEGYLEKGRFFQIGQPVSIDGRHRVIVTVLDESAPETKETPQATAWREFFEEVNASSEEMPERFNTRHFERVDGLKFINWVE